jgi:hydroxyacylglutathione hydrolase
MLKFRRIFWFSLIISVSLAIIAIAQNAPAAGGQAGTAEAGARLGGRGTMPATPVTLQKKLLMGTFRFSAGGVNMYLVVGKEKALLIDTGNPGNISPADVNAITNLPLLVVNTHAHPDHSGSNGAFGKVYVHEADLESAKGYSRGGNVELVPIKEGYIFDLGGKKLEVIAVPGHTAGSICLLDAQEKLLFGGDTANTETWAFISNVPLETYKKSMERLLKWKDQYDLLLPGHNEVLPVSYIDELIACADEILTGKAAQPTQTAQPAQPTGRGGLTAGSLTHKYKSAMIRYNPNNLREKTN